MINSTVNEIDSYCEWEEGKAYVMLLIPRKKENGKNTEKEKLGLMQRAIVRNYEEVVETYDYFKEFTSRYPEIVFRLYLTVNRRCLTKGMFALAEDVNHMIKDMHYGNKEVFDRFKKISSKSKSLLCEPRCRDQKYFHFDVDWDNDSAEGNVKFDELIRQLRGLTKIKWGCETLNGYAIVTEPFNPLDLKKLYDLDYKPGKAKMICEDVEIKPDNYLYFDVYNYTGE